MLSDSCFDFLSDFEEAARKLAEAVHWYSSPDNSMQYGEEIDALRRACQRVQSDTKDMEARLDLVRLATSVMRFHDTPPNSVESTARQEQMLALVGLLREGAKDEEAARHLVAGLRQDGREGEDAVSRVRPILTRLGKSAYDVAVKIISDIGSATVKKMLGL